MVADLFKHTDFVRKTGIILPGFATSVWGLSLDDLRLAALSLS
jgi:hypothetical protein